MLEEKDDNLLPADGLEENLSAPKPKKTASEEKKEETDVVVEVDVLHEIDSSNAEDAEDEDNKHRHTIPMLDYHSLSMEKLVKELEKLVKNEKIQAIKNHVDGIKHEFDLKFQELLEQKKEDFLHGGGNELDFKYTSPLKTEFNNLYNEYRDKRNHYYKTLEQNLKANLAKRLEIIEELKGLINVETNINDIYKHFKELQEKWRSTGPIPRINYNDVWRTYQHHVEIFYDFMDLNRDLRDLDFKHNLEEKLKIVQKAEELAVEPDVNKAFRELQMLHKVWKEDIGPVDREHRDEVWNRFSAATKTIHHKRQEYLKNIDQVYEQNFEAKKEIISKILEIAGQKVEAHSQWQNQIKKIETLREAFFNAGKVPSKVNEETWSAFKDAVRRFNRTKNSFYKNLKKDQHENLEKKLELVKLAEELKDSENWAETTPIMKKIQDDWKKIGHVPKKYSDKVWEDFKKACNAYFSRLHAQRNDDHREEDEAFEKKKAFLDKLKGFELSGKTEKDLESIKTYIAEWKSIGRVPFNKRNIEAKFNKILDALFKKLNVDRQQSELIKYGNKIDELANADNERAIQNERVFIKRKIDELKNDIRQLENNLQFFNADANNPIVREVVKNIDKQKDALALWKAKLKKLKNINEEE